MTALSIRTFPLSASSSDISHETSIPLSNAKILNGLLLLSVIIILHGKDIRLPAVNPFLLKKGFK